MKRLFCLLLISTIAYGYVSGVGNYAVASESDVIRSKVRQVTIGFSQRADYLDQEAAAPMTAELLQSSRERFALAEKTYGELSPQLADETVLFAKQLQRAGRRSEARVAYRTAAFRYDAAYPDEHLMAAKLRVSIGWQYARYVDAKAHYSRALRIIKKHFGKSSPEYMDIQVEIGKAAMYGQRAQLARQFFDRAYEGHRNILAVDDVRRAKSARWRAEYALLHGNLSAGEELLTEAVQTCEISDAVNDAECHASRAVLVGVLSDMGLTQEAQAQSLALGLLLRNGEDGPHFLIYEKTAEYPSMMLRNRQEGWVDLRFSVLADGTVDAIEVLGGKHLEGFSDSATAAVRQWRFAPAIGEGTPIKTEGVRARVEFRLRRFYSY